jgi:hypothetical protein
MSASGCASRDAASGELESIERARLTHYFSVTGALVHVAVQGQFGIVTTEPGEGGYITSVYREGFHGWKWHKQQAGLPGSCLFEAGDVPKEVAKRLTDGIEHEVPKLTSQPSYECEDMRRLRQQR